MGGLGGEGVTGSEVPSSLVASGGSPVVMPALHLAMHLWEFRRALACRSSLLAQAALAWKTESGWEPSDALSSSAVGVIKASKPWIGIWSCLSWSGFPGISRGNSGRAASATGPSREKGVTALKEKCWEG